MGFINIKDYQPIEPVPGCRMRTPFGKNLMLSYLEMDAGAVVPLHSHPHEQGGMLIKGTLELTIGDETRRVEAGAVWSTSSRRARRTGAAPSSGATVQRLHPPCAEHS